MNKAFDKNGDSDWIRVNSSNLYAVQYNNRTGVLKVQFGQPTPVSEYKYNMVTFREFNELINAPSHGSYFSSMIRGKKGYEKQALVTDIDAFNARRK